MRRGLDTEVVDDPRFTPDLFRVRGMIQAGVWPGPRRSSKLVEIGGEYQDWPLASNMVALGFGTGEKARLLVLRPYRDESGKLRARGVVISDSPEQREAEKRTDAESLQWGAGLQRTGIPWEYGAKHYKQRIEDLSVDQFQGVKGLVRALTEGQLSVRIKPGISTDEPTPLDIPKDPFVFLNQSDKLVHEQGLHSIKTMAKNLIPGRK